jgi:hypothetical protein
LSSRSSAPAPTTEQIGHELLAFAHPDIGLQHSVFLPKRFV